MLRLKLILGSVNKGENGRPQFDWIGTRNKKNLARQTADHMDLLNKYAHLTDPNEVRSMFDDFANIKGMQDEAAALRRLVGDADAYNAKLAEIRASKEAAIKSTSGFSGALKSLGGVAKTVGATLLQFGAMFVASWIVNGVVDFVDQQINAAKYAKEALQEVSAEWDELNEKQKSAGDLVEKYEADYERLSKGVNMVTGENLTLSDEEYTLFKQINTELANSALASVEGITVAYDAQGNAIVRLNDQMDGLSGAYKALEQQTRDAVQHGLPSVIEKMQAVLEPGFWQSNTGPKERLSIANQLYGRLNNNESLDSLQWLIKTDTAAVEQVISGLGYSNSRDLLKAMGDGVDIRPALASYIRSQQAEIDLALSPAKSAMKTLFTSDLADDVPNALSGLVIQYIDQLSAEHFVGKTDNDLSVEMAKLVQLVSTETARGAIESLQGAQTDFAMGDMTYGQYTEVAEAQFAEFMADEWPEEFQGLLKESFGLDGSSTHNRAAARLQKIVSDSSEEWIKSLTADQLNFAMSLSSSGQMTKDRFNQRYTDYKQTQTYSVDTIASNYSDIAAAQTVMDEVMQNQGHSMSITTEQYKQLLDAGSEYADCIKNVNGYMQLDIDAAKQLVSAKYAETQATLEAGKAQKLQKYGENAKNLQAVNRLLADKTQLTEAEIKALEAQARSLENEQDKLRSDIDAYNRLGSEIAYATSAYKKWMDAQNAPEAGDAYNNMITAMGQIQEGLDSGKIGTAKFKAAVELLVPEGEDVEQYMKVLGEYLTEGSDGLQKFIDNMFAKGFLSKGPNGMYSFMAGTTVEDIAKGLGLTDELTRYMLQALQDYGWNVDMFNQDYNTDALLKKREDAVKQQQDNEKELARLKGQAVQDTEAIAAAEKKLAESTAEVAALDAEIANQAPQTKEMTVVEQLEADLKRLQDLYDQLGAMELGGKVNAQFMSDITNLQSVLTLISEQPESGYTVSINTDSEKSDALSKITEIKEAINTISQLATDGVISYEVAAELTGNLTTDMAALESAVNAYNTKAKSLSVSATLDDQVSGELDELQKGPYNTEMGVSLNAEDVAKIEATLSDMEKRHQILREASQKPYSQGNTEEEGSLPEYQAGGWNGYANPAEAAAAKAATSGAEDFVDSAAAEAAMNITQAAIGGLNEAVEAVEKGFAEDLDFSKWDDTQEAQHHSNSELADLASNSEPVQVPVEPVLPTDPAELKVEADTSAATSAIDKVVSYGNGKTATLRYNAKFVGPGYANGTQNSGNEDAMVGEDGVETIVTKGHYYTVGHNGPEIVHLNRGDQVLTNAQTKKLFGGNSRKSGRAYAEGRENFLGNFAAVAFGGLVGNVVKGAIDVAGDGKGTLNSTTKKSGSGSKSSGTDYKKILEEFEKLHDWIVRALEVAQKYTQNLIDGIKDYVGYIAQNKQVDKALQATRKEIELNQQAYVRYMQQAHEAQTKLGLSDEIVQKIHEGTIDIESYDETTKKKIDEYQEWFEKAEGCKDAIEDLKDQERELQLQRMDNIIEDYANRLDYLDDQSAKVQREIEYQQAIGAEVKESSYRKLIDGEQKKMIALQRERVALETEFNQLIASGVIEVGSEDWHNYRNEIESIDEAIHDAAISTQEFADEIYNLNITKLQNLNKVLQNIQSSTEGIMSLHDAQGAKNVSEYYETLILNGHEQIANLEEQNALIRAQMEGLDVHSDKYQELLGDLTANTEAINGIKVSQEQWNDSIADLKIDTLQEEREALEKTNEEYQKQLELEEALEALAKAKRQRTKLVYKENVGFVYQADQDAIDEAQRQVDDLMHQAKLDAIDNQIEAIEENKENDNVWSYDGGTLLKSDGLVPDAIYSAIQDMLRTNLPDEVYAQTAVAEALQTASAPTAPQITIGDIIISDATNVESLAKDIVNNLPNAILQEMHK